MQKNIRVCCYTGRQIDLRFSRRNAGKARLTFQVRVGSIQVASFGVRRASCSRGGFHNRVWVSIQAQCQIALSRPAQLDESCHGRSLAMAHVLSLVCSLRVVKPPSQDTSAAVDRDSLLRSANRRRQWAADVPCAQSRHRPVGLADGKVRQLPVASGGTH